MGVDRGMEARLRGQGSRPRELIEKGRGEACDLWNCDGGGCIVADVERVDISELVGSEQGWDQRGRSIQFNSFHMLLYISHCYCCRG